MKLLERFVEGAIERSALLVKTANAIHALAAEVHKLGIATLAMANTIQAHQAAILELYARQGLVMKSMKSAALDTQLPDCSDKEKDQKPN